MKYFPATTNIICNITILRHRRWKKNTDLNHFTREGILISFFVCSLLYFMSYDANLNKTILKDRDIAGRFQINYGKICLQFFFPYVKFLNDFLFRKFNWMLCIYENNKRVAKWCIKVSNRMISIFLSYRYNNKVKKVFSPYTH